MPKPSDRTAVLQRLPQYYRILRRFLQNGIYRCSSAEIAAQTEYSAVAVRKDLLRFSGCATKGYGYHVKPLYTMLGDYLGVRDAFRAVIVGDGMPQQLLCEHPLFAVHGIRLCGICSEHAPNPTTAPTHIRPDELVTFCRRERVSLLILLAPIDASLLTEAIAAGVCGVFSLCEDDTALREVAQQTSISYRTLHPMDDLISLCCEMKLAQGEPTESKKESFL